MPCCGACLYIAASSACESLPSLKASSLELVLLAYLHICCGVKSISSPRAMPANRMQCCYAALYTMSTACAVIELLMQQLDVVQHAPLLMASEPLYMYVAAQALLMRSIGCLITAAPSVFL